MTKMLHTTILAATAMTTALIAGLFYAYSCSVNPGLGRLGDKEYIAAMQGINIAIINPLFMMSFMGTLVLLPVCTFMQYSTPATPRFWLLLLASLFYVIGVFGVTALGNIPLNDAMARIDLQSPASELHAQRLLFEGPWNSLNRIRSVCSCLSTICVSLACMAGKQQWKDIWQ